MTMGKNRLPSAQTRSNWFIDALLFMAGTIAALSGIYFLYFPTGGFQGGRNPMYGITIIFARHTWENLHTWGGIGMILIAVVHFLIHWRWVVSMTKRVIHNMLGRPPFMNNRGRFNVMIDAVVAISFLVTAISGLYLFFVPGGAQGRLYGDPMILFSRVTWDLIHTWAGVVMIIAAVIHFAIHWGWVVKVSSSLFGAVGQWMQTVWSSNSLSRGKTNA